MKNLLNYQSSEYDCGPVTLTNAVRYLFEREDIYPDIIKYIMLYCLDSYNEDGEVGKHGTSATAMMFLSNWLNQFGKMKNFPIACEFLSGADVHIDQTSKILCALQQGGVVVLRLFLDVGHYVLLTGIAGDSLYLFDPYYEEEDDPELSEEYSEPGITFISNQPKRANRLVSIERLNRTSEGFYEMGPYDIREAVIVFNQETRLLAEDTIDYFI
ncbi:MAG: peptidase C39 [Roseburia sp.]|nr:peptidase C39 [Roseburia sp.]MCM1242960.1 peptidase C39 [Roseburia sp.]